MSTEQKEVRFGIIGLGSMGSAHANWLLEGKVPGARLTAVTDSRKESAAAFPGIAFYESMEAMLADKAVDAVLIATPHYSHVTLGKAALEAGVHVLVEKPIAVHKADAEELLSVPVAKGQAFGAMFCMRTQDVYRKIKSMIDNGELGQLRRVSWVVTDWFRTHAYYASGSWRATWAGEGGGVLINQCPHQLDLWQWLFGKPDHIFAKCAFGRYHEIEVEDDVTALFSYNDGMTGTFICSTGEAPGTNRLEVAGDRGRLLLENGKLTFERNVVPMGEYSRTTTERFGRPEVWHIEIPFNADVSNQHNLLTTDFVSSILENKPLLAPASEGIHSVEIGNAILLSGLQGKEVSLPIDGAEFAACMQRLIDESAAKRAATAS